MPNVLVRPELRCAWHAQSLLVVTPRGECGEEEPLSGFYFREARHLRTLRLELNGERPWLCEVGDPAPEVLELAFIYPELATFSGGGSGESGADVTTNDSGIPHRALDLRVRYVVGIASLEVALTITNRSAQRVDLDLAWVLGADFADFQEAQGGPRRQRAAVAVTSDACAIVYRYQHPELPYQTHVRAAGSGNWTAEAERLATSLHLAPQESAELALHVHPMDDDPVLGQDDLAARERHWRRWHDHLLRIETPGNSEAETAIHHNVRDLASFPLLDGAADEWLTPQAGIPIYPALFGRDAATAAWQAAMLDRGEMLDAVLTRLGSLQGNTVDDWRDEQPGRIIQQARRGPLARLGVNPFARYYGDYASPLMAVIAIAHLYAWTGERSAVARYWDMARRILDWARDSGDLDGDGYLEYVTRSPQGQRNQGWKDSGNGIVDEHGGIVPNPIATCELQGYWFASQQLMAVLSWAMGERGDAKAYWRSAMALKVRFNRDWWMDDEGFIALAMDPDKRLVRTMTSNAGHCVAAGIVDDVHLPRVAGRMFAPDLFSGWGIRTLSTRHSSYNPLSYHLGSVWAVENATIAFGLRRFGFDARALDIARAMFDLARLYPDFRIPECVGGYARSERAYPGAYPRANAPQLWNASVFPLLVHTILGLQPVAPLDLLVIDPALPTWLPKVTLRGLRLGGATATLRFWRDDDGASHGEILHKRGTLHLIHQPPPESLRAGAGDRFGALVDSVFHH